MKPLTSSVVPLVARTLHIARHGTRVITNALSERARELDLAHHFTPRRDDAFIAAAYFAGDTRSLYQIEQWLWSFERLRDALRRETGVAEPFGIVCRSAANAAELSKHTTLPIRFTRLRIGLDDFMGHDEIRVMFYVNQTTSNFQSLQFARPAHVHLSHGESEKASMVSNQLKAYDKVFIAGKAARDRIHKALIGVRDEALVDVGRPQLDEPVQAPESWAQAQAEARDAGRDEAPVVFFAPTWEGDSPAMAYGTLPEAGPELVRSLLSSGARVIFRPHPRTGILDSKFRRAQDAIAEVLKDAPGSLMDVGSPNGWHAAVADACVAEMSSLAFDWLATGKPLLLLEPTNERAVTVEGGLYSAVASVKASDAAALRVESAALVREVKARKAGTLSAESSLPRASADESAARFATASVAQHYFGDTTPGAQQARFEQAALSVIAEREAVLSQFNG